MQRWQDYFSIKEIEPSGPDQFMFDYKYQVVVSSTGQAVGVYNDERYARKQAKYKFKKIQAKLEKILLG